MTLVVYALKIKLSNDASAKNCLRCFVALFCYEKKERKKKTVGMKVVNWFVFFP